MYLVISLSQTLLLNLQINDFANSLKKTARRDHINTDTGIC